MPSKINRSRGLHSNKYGTSEQAMASLILKKIRPMPFLIRVECGKFKLKKAFQSGKILACAKTSEICAISTLKLIKMMLKCQV